MFSFVNPLHSINASTAIDEIIYNEIIYDIYFSVDYNEIIYDTDMRAAVKIVK